MMSKEAKVVQKLLNRVRANNMTIYDAGEELRLRYHMDDRLHKAVLDVFDQVLLEGIRHREAVEELADLCQYAVVESDQRAQEAGAD